MAMHWKQKASVAYFIEQAPPDTFSLSKYGHLNLHGL